jgi:hypothetical protein
MNSGVGAARIGQWYTYWDTKETFRVTAYNDKSCTIETQALDGDRDAIDEAEWSTLPLDLAEPPEDWTETLDPNASYQECLK